jgi:hypothetical protein
MQIGVRAACARRLTKSNTEAGGAKMSERAVPAGEPQYPVTIGPLILAFSWAADEAGYDLEETNDVSQLILRAWRTVENHGTWQRVGEPPSRPKLVRDEVTEIIPVVTAV